MKQKTIIITFIFFLLLIFAALYQLGTKNKNVDISEEGILFGNESAENVLIFFTSFNCEKCQNFHENIHDYIVDEVNSGNLKVIYKVTNVEFYSVPNDVFYNVERLSEYYFNNDLYCNSVWDGVNLDSSEIEKRQHMYITIRNEIEQSDISVLPTFFFNGIKYTGSYSREEFHRILTYNLG